MYNDLRKLKGLHVHVLGWQESTTGSASLRLLERDLRTAGAKVMLTALPAGDHKTRIRVSGIRLLRSMDWDHGTERGPRFDASIHVGHVWRSWFGLAGRNLLLAQSPWPAYKMRRLKGIDGVLCQTRTLRQAFAEQGLACADIGWTCRDRGQRDVLRVRAFFHHSTAQTATCTRHLLALWRKHPEWPCLTVLVTQPAVVTHAPGAENIRLVGDGIDDAQRKYMQNAHLFHLCLGPGGGDGKDLGEALSTGAVTLSLVSGPMDAPEDDHGGVLVPTLAGGVGTSHPAHAFNEAAMELAIERVMAMGDSGIETISGQARAWFERNQLRFAQDLATAVEVLGCVDQSASREAPEAANASR